jgi:hypothetical protein
MNTSIPHPMVAENRLNDPRTQSAFRVVKPIVGGYVGISVLALVTAYVWRNDAALVTDVVWVRGFIVLVTSLLILSFALGAARGRRRAWLRLRFASGIMVVAIVVLVAWPGLLPLWMRIEQGVCGLLLLIVAFIVNSEHMRAVFAK